MDESKLNELINNLPESVKDFAYQSEWESRVVEIGKKYNLNDAQVEDLANNTLMLIIGEDDSGGYLKNIKEELEISDIVAEQIMEDIDKRVFDYALKFTDSESETPAQKPTSKNPIPKMIYPENKTPASVPEIKPNNLPMGSNEPVKVGVPRYIPGESKPTQATTSTTGIRNEQTIGGSRITYGQTATAETAQKPVNTPELDITKKEAAPVIPSPSSNKSIIDEKLNKITTGVVEETPKTTPLQKNYSVDPYREPLE